VAGNEVLIDYKKSYDTYQKYILNNFKDYKIYVYFTTNILNEKEKEEICNDYKPIKYYYL